MSTFNMTDLSRAVAAEFGLSLEEASERIRFVFDRLKQAVASGAQVRLHRFGTLEARMRKPGIARHLVTGAPIPVAAHRVPKLTPSPAWLAMLA